MEEVLEKEKFKWYALYSVANQEKTTKQNIERELSLNNLSKYLNRIEVPTEKIVVNGKSKKHLREKVLLPGYIFINIDLSSNGEVLPILRRCKGILGFINPSDGKSRQTPEQLRDSEVERFLNVEKDETVLENSIKFNVGETVKITDGAFSTFNGEIQNIDANKKILKLIVKIFSRETPVEVEFNQVVKI